MRADSKPVSIGIDTYRKDAESIERDSKSFFGSRSEVNGKIYLRYKEVLAEGEEPIASMLVIDGNDLRLHRKGTYGGDMLFLLGKKSNVNYVTPMGVVPMVVDTSGLDLFISEQKIEINLEYKLYAGDSDGIWTKMRIVANCPAC